MTRWLDRRVAPLGPYLTLCLTEAEFKSALKHLKAKDQSQWTSHGYGGTTHIYGNNEGKTTCIVCISDYKGRSPVEVAGLLVHEAVHVWQQYLADISEKNPSSEQEAYGIQCIAQTLMEEFARRLNTT